MARARNRLACAATLIASLAAGGCGLGPGSSSEGEATLTVTRDYGSEVLVEAEVSDPSESDTVIRVLDSEADITTRYGGGFVQSIEGVSGGVEGGRSFDWFFYVNGVESPVGAAEAEVRAGDRIWWDHRDWTDAMRVPAVVGSWPQPFAGGAEDAREPVPIGCAAAQATCEQARRALAEEGVAARVVAPDALDGDAPGMLVGSWSEIGAEPAARPLADGPGVSGVFAVPGNGGALEALDERAEPALRLGPGAGLVAATAAAGAEPTWLVTGTDERGVEAAVAALEPASLEGRYAVALAPGSEAQALPIGSGG